MAGESVRRSDEVRDAPGRRAVLAAAAAAVTFIGSLLVGLRASAPIEQIRRRQAEFTADASHELRTPLSVIEAEVDLALQRDRTPPVYRETLRRVARESERLRKIVDDLLWLARVDSDPDALPVSVPVDVSTVAAASVERFGVVAEQRGVTLRYSESPAPPCVIQASAAWIDRLIGVIVDNACKFAGQGGQVEVGVFHSGGRVVLRVDDSGPGIPPAERETVFDRFHRATADQEGTGLGLAIGDAVVKITGGSWSLGESPLGGARFEVSWRRSTGRAHPDEPGSADLDNGPDQPVSAERADAPAS